LSRAERKQLLILACALDRTAWNDACRPAANRSPIGRIAGDLMGLIGPLSHLLPRRLGRWIRGAVFIANLGRQLGWLIR